MKIINDFFKDMKKLFGIYIWTLVTYRPITQRICILVDKLIEEEWERIKKHERANFSEEDIKDINKWMGVKK